MKDKTGWTLALVALLAFGSAQAAVVRVTNANDHEIPIKVGTEPEIDSEGNVIVECALNASNVCAALNSSTPVTGAPTASLARNDNNTSVLTGEFISLTWGSSLATTCSGTATGPVVTSWIGPKATSNGSGETVTFGTAGSYTFQLQCFNTAGSSPMQMVTVVVAEDDGSGEGEDGGGAEPTGCDIDSDPDVEPAGWNRVNKSWRNLLYLPAASNPKDFPEGPSYPAPLPYVNITSYTVTPFAVSAGQFVNISWDQVQPNNNIGYNPSRPAAAMFFTISPCPGDFRAPNDASPDLFLRSRCRRWENSGGLAFGDYTGDNVCKLDPLETYYLNIIAADPSGGIDPGEESCEDTAPSGCDVGVRVQSSSL